MNGDAEFKMFLRDMKRRDHEELVEEHGAELARTIEAIAQVVMELAELPPGDPTTRTVSVSCELTTEELSTLRRRFGNWQITPTDDGLKIGGKDGF